MTQYRLYFETSEAKAKAINARLEPLFEEDGFAHSIFETNAENSLWSLSVYLPEEEVNRVSDILLCEMKAVDIDASINEETLEDTGWIEKTLAELKPVRAGRFLVHGAHDKHLAKPNLHAIQIDAGLAFGTGHHGTTAGCLLMIEEELKYLKPRNALDLGAGTGVLAIAIAKAKRIPVLASDIDPVAQQIAKDNARLNGVSEFVHSITSTGFNNNEFNTKKPFDLIVANILCKPLQNLAFDLSLHLTKGATIILSGLLPHQKATIVSTYRAQGLYLKRAHIQDGWLVLVLKNGH